MFLYLSTIIASLLLLTVTQAFSLLRSNLRSSTLSSSLKMTSPLDSFSLFTAELLSGPTARYNGELIDQSLKLVEKVPKPEGYVYGNVAPGAETFLAFGALVIVGVGALVPFILSIGESAQVQQREREAEDRIATYEFTQNKKGKGRNALEFNKSKVEAKPAASTTKPSKGPFSFKK